MRCLLAIPLMALAACAGQRPEAGGEVGGLRIADYGSSADPAAFRPPPQIEPGAGWAWRESDRRRHALGRYGGNADSERAVDAALRFLAHHQDEDGFWRVDGYPANCALDGPKCEPGGYTSHNASLAVTGLATWCFLGAGHRPDRAGPHLATVERALNAILASQGDDGSWGRNYETAICVQALAEAAGMTGDERWRDPCVRGVQALLGRQCPLDEGGTPGAWNYAAPNLSRHDSCVSSWAVSALRAARLAEIEVRDSLIGAGDWVERTWRSSNPGWEDFGRDSRARFPYTWDPRTGRGIRYEGRQVFGLACFASTLHPGTDPAIGRSLANATIAEYLDADAAATIRRRPFDLYRVYHATNGMFALGGEPWQRWNEALREGLIGTQRFDGCFAGSWDPAGMGAHHVAEVGRLLTTTLACLCLEVYYRFPPPDGPVDG